MLKKRLETLNDEIGALREQQRVLVQLLRNRKQFGRARTLDKEGWVALLRATGLSEDDMRRWHIEFERSTPEAHQDFLESLGIPGDEAAAIRCWSREASEG